MSKIKTIATTTLAILGGIKCLEILQAVVVKLSSREESETPSNYITSETSNYITSENGNITDISNGLVFVRTCKACPEQYDVTKDDKKVAYVRLRFGALRCDYKYCGGEIIYSHTFHDDMKGSFDNDEERLHYLGIISNKVTEKLDLDQAE